MKLLVHASGYTVEPAWRGHHDEIRCTLPKPCGGDGKCKWSPSSVDFAHVGINSGGSSPAATIDQLVTVVSNQAAESIEELRILGHANDEVLALAGKVLRDDVSFNEQNAWIGPFDAFKNATPKLRDLQDRFTANAKVVLLGCNSGSGKDALLKVVSEAFLRTVAGFKEQIKFNFSWNPAGPAVRNGTKVVCHNLAKDSKITLRGRMMYSPQGNLLADVFGEESMLGAYKLNAWDLQPDVFDNTGDMFVAVRRKQASDAAWELAWRIMRTFYPNHAWVSGTSVDPLVPGLKVRKDGASIFIDIKPEWGSKTTPKNLKDRVAEMGKALELVARKQEGVIPMK